MTLIRVEHKKNYTVVNNFICTDKRLSWKAKGIWLYAFSRPNNWTFHTNDLIKQSKDGTDSVSSGLKELEEAGYLLRKRHRENDGTFSDAVWTFFETPQCLKEKVPKGENPDQAIPDQVNPPILNTEEELNTENNKQAEAKTEAKKEGPVVVVPDCLKKLKIPEQEKQWLAKKYSPGEIEHAVAYTEAPGTQIKTTLIQTLKWACKEQPELPKCEEDVTEENKSFAKKKEGLRSQFAFLEILTRGVEIVYRGCQKIPEFLEYTDRRFKEKLEEHLSRCRFA